MYQYMSEKKSELFLWLKNIPLDVYTAICLFIIVLIYIYIYLCREVWFDDQ